MQSSSSSQQQPATQNFDEETQFLLSDKCRCSQRLAQFLRQLQPRTPNLLNYDTLPHDVILEILSYQQQATHARGQGLRFQELVGRFANAVDDTATRRPFLLFTTLMLPQDLEEWFKGDIDVIFSDRKFGFILSQVRNLCIESFAADWSYFRSQDKKVPFVAKIFAKLQKAHENKHMLLLKEISLIGGPQSSRGMSSLMLSASLTPLCRKIDFYYMTQSSHTLADEFAEFLKSMPSVSSYSLTHKYEQTKELQALASTPTMLRQLNACAAKGNTALAEILALCPVLQDLTISQDVLEIEPKSNQSACDLSALAKADQLRCIRVAQGSGAQILCQNLPPNLRVLQLGSQSIRLVDLRAISHLAHLEKLQVFLGEEKSARGVNDHEHLLKTRAVNIDLRLQVPSLASSQQRDDILALNTSGRLCSLDLDVKSSVEWTQQLLTEIGIGHPNSRLSSLRLRCSSTDSFQKECLIPLVSNPRLREVDLTGIGPLQSVTRELKTYILEKGLLDILALRVA